MVPKENGDHRFMVNQQYGQSLAAPTVIYTAGKEGCHLVIFTAGPYSSAAIQRLCKGTTDFCHYFPLAAGCTVKNMAGPYSSAWEKASALGES